MKKMGGVALGGRILANRLEPCFIPFYHMPTGKHRELLLE